MSCARSPFLRVGLTGGIASGKSTAARFFSEAGVPVLDADALVRELSAPGGRAHTDIVRQFGTADRAALRERIFRDPSQRKILESILHPLVAQESASRMLALQAQGAPGVVYEAALLIEAGRAGDFDELVVVTSPEELRLARIQARDGLTREGAEAVLRAQLSDEERLRFATQVLRNDGSLADLKAQVLALKNQLLGREEE
jgi:dephospho-CoA kinase